MLSVFDYTLDPYLVCEGRKLGYVVDVVVVKSIFGGKNQDAVLAFPYTVQSVDQSADHAVTGEERLPDRVIRVGDSVSAFLRHVFAVGAEELRGGGGEDVTCVVKME